MKKKKKVLIFIVAYDAEKHLEKVLNKIPVKILNKYDHEVLVIDDASKDRTFEVGKGYQKKFKNFNLKVLYNPENQGYGGNQKLGYQYAIKRFFDVVVLLHGDGQYAPELIENMFSPILEKRANAVFGSRFLNIRDPLKGGMPFYKYAGNIVLSSIQNKLLGSKLSEFHSGYRAYEVNMLKRIPFSKNSNDFHFDTQIIIQLLLAKARILEIPIPTYYGNEICHVNGIDYALKVLTTTLLSQLHKAGILYQPEFDVGFPIKYPIKMGYKSSHTLALDNVPVYAKVLSLGCGDGYLENKLKEKHCQITGIDQVVPSNRKAFDSFIKLDLNESSKLPKITDLEVILMMDIIEHLNSPETFLEDLRRKIVGSRSKIILTTANVGFIIVRMQLMLGSFNYGLRGILDFTHKRLYTFKSIEKLMNNSGFKVQKLLGIPAPFPEAIGRGKIGLILVKINDYLIKLSKGLFSYQIYLEAKPVPNLDEILLTTLRTEKHDHKQSKN